MDVVPIMFMYIVWALISLPIIIGFIVASSHDHDATTGAHAERTAPGVMKRAEHGLAAMRDRVVGWAHPSHHGARSRHGH